MNPIENLKSVIKAAEQKAQEELIALRNHRKEAETLLDQEITASTVIEFSRVQQERHSNAGKLRIMERSFCPISRTSELLNSDEYKPELIEALGFLKTLHGTHERQRKESLVSKLQKAIEGVLKDDEPEKERDYSLAYGAFAKEVIKTPSERLEALQLQVDVFPSDWELPRIVAEMTGLHAALTELPKPQPANRPLLAQLGSLFRRAT